jgi:hypothetical protein
VVNPDGEEASSHGKLLILMLRSAATPRVSKHEATISPVAHPSRRGLRPLLRMRVVGVAI